MLFAIALLDQANGVDTASSDTPVALNEVKWVTIDK